MANLALQADLEKFLQINVTSEPDAAITAYLQSASTIIETYCNRVFTSGTVTAEKHDGGHAAVFLLQPPVTSITTVVENAVTLAAADYMFYSDGRLVRMSGGYPYVWFWKPQTVVVTYVGGYTTIPFDVRDVCVRIAARAFQAGAAFAGASASAGSLKSITLAGSDSVTYSDAVSSSVATAAVQLTQEDKTVLNPYRILNVA